jgi:peptidoglycan hydrolase-like protein with peptidoglycan-binding domain
MERDEVFTRPLREILRQADHKDLEFEIDPDGRTHRNKWVRRKVPVFDPMFEDPAVERMRAAWANDTLLDEGGDALFELRAGVGDKTPNGRVDVAKIETLLEATGALDLDGLKGPTGLFAAGKGAAIRDFQRANDLEADGQVLPNGPTIKALRAALLRHGGEPSDGPEGTPGEFQTARFIRPPIGPRPRPGAPAPPPLPPISGGRPPNPVDPKEPKKPVEPPKLQIGTTLPPFEEGKPQILIFPDISEEIGQIYIDERRETQETRDEIDYIRDYFIRRYGWEHLRGGRHAPGTKDKDDKDISGQEKREDYIPGPGVAFVDKKTEKHGDMRPGHVRPDLTFVDRNGKTIFIQHVDVDKKGYPTQRELEAAERLRRATKSQVIMIPKLWQLRRIKNPKKSYPSLYSR